MRSIGNLIHAVQSVPGATKIPENEQQSFDPPHIPSIRHLSNEQVGKVDILNSNSNDNWLPDPDFTDDSIPRPFTDNDDELSSAIARSQNKTPRYGTTEEHGVEALAWYVSFHTSRYWGIYIPYSGLFRLADIFRTSTISAIDAVQLAWDGLLAHESVHFAVDVACAELEILTHSPVYLLRSKMPYGYSELEEQIANGNLLSAIKRSSREIGGSRLRSSPINAAIRMVRTSPPGYRDGEKSVSVSNFTDSANYHLGTTLASALSHFKGHLSGDINASALFPCVLERGRVIPNRINISQCPMYVFDDINFIGGGPDVIRFITSLPHIEETGDFLEALTPEHVRAWEKTKSQLANPCINKRNPNLDFQRWEDDDKAENGTRAWSVRVGGAKSNYRAHINEVVGRNRWIANKFGDGDKMGHHKRRR